MEEYVYDAFISYSHRDLNWARWVQRRVETFRVPKDVPNRSLMGRHLRVFRDQTDLAGSELQEALRKELRASRDLIVICSPASAASRWVNDEVSFFRSLGEGRRIIPFIVKGEPESDKPELECYVPALRNEENWHPLGASVPEIGRNKAFLKLIAILLDLRFNRLVDREKQRRRRSALIAGSAAAVVGAVTAGLLWRNAVISKKNQELSFDIYGAAMMAISQKDVIEPADLEFLRVSAEAGNVEAMFYLASCCKNGWGMEVNQEQAFSWFLQAAEAGDPGAMVGAANCYFSGSGVAADAEEGFRWSRRAAEAGDLNAMNMVADCLERGNGTERNEEEAFSWYREAAQRGDSLSIYDLALCYRNGIGTEVNPEQAFYWMKKLAETGAEPGARFGMFNVGLMYEAGYGTEKNPREAYLWYRKAAEAGDADGMYKLAWCIENCYGTDGTDSIALEWYRRALEQGNEAAGAEIERLVGASSAAKDTPEPKLADSELPAETG